MLQQLTHVLDNTYKAVCSNGHVAPAHMTQGWLEPAVNSQPASWAAGLQRIVSSDAEQ
jgi:hypothetical protein